MDTERTLNEEKFKFLTDFFFRAEAEGVQRAAERRTQVPGGPRPATPDPQSIEEGAEEAERGKHSADDSEAATCQVILGRENDIERRACQE